jgi:hypothetical protein
VAKKDGDEQDYMRSCGNNNPIFSTHIPGVCRYAGTGNIYNDIHKLAGLKGQNMIQEAPRYVPLRT